MDHNIRTFHGMGIIARATPGVSSLKPIKRKTVEKEDVIKAGEITVS